MTIDSHRFTIVMLSFLLFFFFFPLWQRLYGVVAGVAPAAAFLHGAEGIVKFATAPFDPRRKESAVIAQRHYRAGVEHAAQSIGGNCSRGFCAGSRWDLEGFRSHLGEEQFAKVRSNIRQCFAAAVRVALSGGRVVHRTNSFQANSQTFFSCSF